MFLSEYRKILGNLQRQAKRRGVQDPRIVMRRFSDLTDDVDPPELCEMIPQQGGAYYRRLGDARERGGPLTEATLPPGTVVKLGVELVGGN